MIQGGEYDGWTEVKVKRVRDLSDHGRAAYISNEEGRVNIRQAGAPGEAPPPYSTDELWEPFSCFESGVGASWWANEDQKIYFFEPATWSLDEVLPPRAFKRLRRDADYWGRWSEQSWDNSNSSSSSSGSSWKSSWSWSGW